MDEVRLREIPLFAGLSRKQRRAVAMCADEVEVPAGTRLCREGEFPYEFFAIEEGTAKVMRGEQYLNDLGPGDFFGETGLLSDQRRNASVIAESPIRAIVMTGPAFRHIDREMPEVSKRLRRAIDERSRWLEPVDDVPVGLPSRR
ncbi:MAG TPA: cyclic nucleotide-binding domain-containing protein [Thermoleophilaceae bacterium]|jgi:CRP-like cAMP-binding protein